MMHDTSSFRDCSVSEAARAYLRRGWAPIPVRSGQKAPSLKDWPKLKLGEDDIPALFTAGDNVGILLGEPSGGLIDVDLDTPETIALAPEFLTETDAIFGRPSNPESHWLYISDRPLDTVQFKGGGGVTIAELRSTGCQTVFPPSHHSGEAVTWHKGGNPACVDGQTLQAAVARLAAAVELARHWPQQGSRQEAALALAGGLVRVGWTSDAIAAFVSVVAKTAGDEETAKRATAAELTVRRIAGGGTSTGWRRLEEIIGAGTVRGVARWLRVQPRSMDGQDTGCNQHLADGKGASQAQTLVSIALTANLFHTPEGDAYGSFQISGHSETWQVRSKGFKDWLMHSYYLESTEFSGVRSA